MLGIEIRRVPNNDGAVHLLLRRECLPFVEMAVPVLETVGPRGGRRTITCHWRHGSDDSTWFTGPRRSLRSVDKNAISILWRGEVWPRFVTALDDGLRPGVVVTTLGARTQVVLQKQVVKAPCIDRQ